MPDYDFRPLSPPAFEDLTRDVLQAEWGVVLESFKAGRDGGIDLRYAPSEDGAIIVQCKHYAGSGYRALVRDLKKEIPKVEALDPGRYVVVTSVGLSPANKQEIAELFDPTAEDDVLGRDDLNNRLGLFPHVEKRHPVLWLASSAVLEHLLDRVVHSGLYAARALAQQELSDLLQVYVTNPSLDLAHTLLREHHYCVIAGEPGIGKSTLAQILVADHLQEGYELVVAHGNIREALDLFDPGAKQIIYYDDFLGRTASRPDLGKNEDRALLSFVRAVKESPNTRFVLTTREYILQQAKSEYERLAHSELVKFTVELSHYTRPIRARILYNHLHTAHLPTPYLEAILADQDYLRIIDHPNYNPRVVEYMTTALRDPRPKPGVYAEAFIALLDDPHVIWRHAFEHDLSHADQHLLLVFATLPDDVDEADLEQAFWAFHRLRSEKHHAATSEQDFTDALRVLEGDFLVSSPEKYQPQRRKFEARNPSVQDFLHHHLLAHAADVADLTVAAVFFEQADTLHDEYAPPPDLAATALQRTLRSPPLRDTHRIQPATFDVARRGAGVVATVAGAAAPAFRPFAEAIIESIEATLPSAVDAEATAQFVRWLDATPATRDLVTLRLLQRVTAILAHRADSLDRVERFFRHAHRHPGAVTEDAVETVRDDFAYYIEQEVTGIEDDASETDPDEIEAYGDRLESLMSETGWTFEQDWVEVVRQAKETAQYEWDKAEDFWNEHGGFPRVSPDATGSPEDNRAITDLFDTLTTRIQNA